MSRRPRTSLSLPEARRVALAAQGFGRGRPSGPPTSRQVVDVVRRLGVVQIDSVNVLTRAHYLPAFSRLGGYDRGLLDGAAGRAPRRLFEYWGHEAALLPVELQPFLRWRMERAHADAWGGMVRIAKEQPELVAEVATVVRTHGPMSAADVERVIEHEEPRAREHWGWNWSGVKRALEYLFWAGDLTSAGRDTAFRRRYADPARVLPRTVLEAPTPGVGEAHRQLLLVAARAQGVATAADLADHFRLPVGEARLALDGLVAEASLVEVAVAGWPTAYALPELRVPRRVEACALLVPFDPLVWFRPRTERLFGMRYRIEIYTPAEQRVHGYYVLPFLHDERLVARVDLKADRATARLLVRAAHPEGEPSAAAVAALAGELRALADWLGLGEVVVEPVGALAPQLAGVVAAGP
ncbi:MAG TPA: crosslink repair DNA glycosylase YcaQ family protein [Candidatus Nanopelagicales bacterium]